MANYAILLMLGLEIKHFFGDYILQTSRMLKDKHSLAMPGGYLHAAVHAAGTAIVIYLLSVPLIVAAILVVIDFVVHLLVDFSKAQLDTNISSNENPRAFWALNGIDQLLHHMTYLGMTFVVLWLS